MKIIMSNCSWGRRSKNVIINSVVSQNFQQAPFDDKHRIYLFFLNWIIVR